jgi:hypothetical protein
MRESSYLSTAALQAQTRKDYWHRMKQNKYWRKGWDDAKRGHKLEDNPYTIPVDIIELLKKRTFWLMGFDEFDHSKYARKKRKKEMKRGKSDVAVYDISHIQSSGEWEKKKHHHHKGKKKHGKHQRR